MESNPIRFHDRVEWHNEIGHLHRLDGPAVEWDDGDQEYYINGKVYFPLIIQFDKIINRIEKYGK